MTLDDPSEAPLSGDAQPSTPGADIWTTRKLSTVLHKWQSRRASRARAILACFNALRY